MQMHTPDIHGDPLVLHCGVCGEVQSITRVALYNGATIAYHMRNTRKTGRKATQSEEVLRSEVDDHAHVTQPQGRAAPPEKREQSALEQVQQALDRPATARAAADDEGDDTFDGYVAEQGRLASDWLTESPLE
jgi:hypothetical protein